MKAQLQALSQENTDAIIIVRRIQKLGFKSPEILWAHFEKVGKVKGVHVAHSTVKTQPRTTDSSVEANYRQRPAALGFVVMEEAEAVTKILAEGKERTIEDSQVVVQAFERHEEDEGGEGGGGGKGRAKGRGSGSSSGGEEEEGSQKKGRQKRKRGQQQQQGGGGQGRGGGGGGRRERDTEESPVCPWCGSTIAVFLGMTICQVCKRGSVPPRIDYTIEPSKRPRY